MNAKPSDHHDALIEAARREAEQAINRNESHRRERPPSAEYDAGAFPGYSLLGEIHRGGQGVVYKAVQESTNRVVALKVMFAGPSDRNRFEREVRVLGRLRHPNIVAIHDSGQAAGRFFFVMDYIDGKPLDVDIRQENRSVRDTLHLFAVICDAVNAAHLRGIIHRDLKPSNIRVDHSGSPHILDFGLAKIDEIEATTMTQTGQFVGSLPWASPEQAEGASDRVDLRTDVYSLGVVLYQLLTGRFPYDATGSMRRVLEQIVHTDPIRPSIMRTREGHRTDIVNDEVDTITLKCLSKDPNRRYQSAGELAQDIRRYLCGEPIEAKRDSRLYMLRKTIRHYRAPIAIAVMILIISIAGFATSLSFWRSAVADRTLATERLWDSYLAQARAGRYSGRPGRRFDFLEALAKAATMRPSIELRNEAIAALALSRTAFSA